MAVESGLAFVHDPGARGGKHLPESMGAGIAWLDYDGDGWWDLYTVQSGPFPPDGSPSARDRLWRNRGDGTFEDVTERAGIDERGYGQGALAADLDGDGWSDLYLTRYGPDVFFRNRGDGTFEDATEEAGLGLDGWSSSAAAADADGDGDLDLYVTRYLLYDPAQELFCGDLEKGLRRYCDPSLFEGAGDRLFARQGSGFVDKTSEAGLSGAVGKGLGVLFTDLDGDRRPDLYVANDLSANLLFHNRSPRGAEPEGFRVRFDDVSFFSGAAANREGLFEAGMGLAAGDLDGDGDPEIAVTNFDVETNTLYRNRGAMEFEDISARSGFGVPSFNLLGFGVALADLDRDGALDAWVANGHIFKSPVRANVTHAQADLLFLGDGRGGLQPQRCPWLETTPQVGRGLAVADFDGDGDVDVALSNNGGPLQLWRNEVSSGGFLGVILRGHGANRAAVGASVELKDRAGGRQRRWGKAGDSYQSTSDGRLLFGLGSREISTLEVTWPQGLRQSIVGAPGGRYLVLGEASRPLP